MVLLGKKILFFVGDDYEDLELWYPKLRLEEAGARTTLAGLAANGLYHGKYGYPVQAHESLFDLDAKDFDGLVIPGGWMPDKLRREEKVKALTRDFDAQGKLVGAICHGPWIVQSAGLVKGRTLTSTPGIRDDLVYAGAKWVDQAVVIDGNWVTSRRPADLPEFGAALIRVLSEGPIPR